MDLGSAHSGGNSRWGGHARREMQTAGATDSDGPEAGIGEMPIAGAPASLILELIGVGRAEV